MPKVEESHFLSYKDAKKVVVSNCIRTRVEYTNYVRGKTSELKLPMNPQRYYDEWDGWRNFFYPDAGVADSKRYVCTECNIGLFELKSLLVEHEVSDIDSLNYFLKNVAPRLKESIPRDIESHYRITGEWVSYDDLFSVSKKNEVVEPSGYGKINKNKDVNIMDLSLVEQMLFDIRKQNNQILSLLSK